MATPYDHAIGRVSDKTLEVPEDPMSVQAKVDWLASSLTQKMISELTKDSNQLITEAIGLALTNSQLENHKQIVHKLIEANMLRKVVEKYAKVK